MMGLFTSRAARHRAQSLASRREPARTWPRMAILLGLLLWVMVLKLVNPGGERPYAGLVAGQRAPITVVAQVDFSCEDVAQTELNRQQAGTDAPPVFQLNSAPLNTAIRALDKLFDQVAEARRNYPEAEQGDILLASVAKALDLLGIALSPEDALALAAPGHEGAVQEAIKKGLREIWATGLVSAADLESAFKGQALAGSISIQTSEGVFRTQVRLDDLLLPAKAVDTIVKRITERLEAEAPDPEQLENLVRPWVVPNLVYDAGMTADRRKAARLAVEPVIVRVRSGTTLVEAGESVTPQILERLRAHEKRRLQLELPYDRLLRQVGESGLLLAALAACISVLRLLAPDVLRQNRRITLLLVLSLLSLVPTRLLLDLSGRAVLPSNLIEVLMPLALTPLLTAPLLGASAALALGFWNAFAAAILLENSFPVLLQGLVVTALAAFLARDVRKDSHIYRAGFVIGLAQIVILISLGAVNRIPGGLMALRSLIALGNGLLCAGLVILLIPILEWIFGETTNLTLLELLDMGHPLLQRLAMEAPGTYHHSIVVANLAQAAALDIGANALLTRVAAYYHDIGKLAKPEFFTENTRPGENPHEELTPQMSTLVITSHVKEGISLARRHKLPRCVMDGIEQHHGTGMVSFFYQRAKRLQGGGGNSRASEPHLPEGGFRYDGPRPRSREMAILALADSVEAAARSLEKPTPARLESLVHELAAAKVRDGQFDECPLTLAELAKLKRSFVYSLANMLHVRVAYTQNENQTAQPAEAPSSPAHSAARPDEPPAGPGSP